MELFHGSNEIIEAIKDEGIFGGLFAGSIEAAESHGSIVYKITANKVLEQFQLNYEIEGARETALQICDGDEELAEHVMSDTQPDLDDAMEAAEMGWEVQRLRGKLAAALGFDAVEMEDEHGTVWLCLPTCKIERL